MKTKFLLALACSVALSLSAQVPSLLSYQGRVTASGTNFNGVGAFKFALVTHGTNLTRQATAMASVTSGSLATVIIYDHGAGYYTPPVVTIANSLGPPPGTGAVVTASVSGGAVTGLTIQNPGHGYSSVIVNIAAPQDDYYATTIWNNSGSTLDGIEPSSPVALPVANGLFMVNLGDLAMMVPLNPSIFASSTLWLRVWFSADGSNFQRLMPDQTLAAAPYAMMALNASNVVGTVPAAGLAGTYGGAVSFTNAGNGFTGNGAALTGLNANQLTTGTVPEARLSANVALLSANQKFTGANIFLNANVTDTAGTGGMLHVGGYQADGTPKLINFGDVDAMGLGYVYIGESGSDDTMQLRAGRYYFQNGNVGIGVPLPSTALEVGGIVKANIFQGADNQPLEILVNGARTLRLEPGQSGYGAPNIVAGCSANYVAPGMFGSTIAGGGMSFNNHSNAIYSSASTISGGVHNLIGTNTQQSTIAGGYANSIYGVLFSAAIGGGYANTINSNASYGTIGGGGQNTIYDSAPNSTIGGGSLNSIGTGAWCSTIGGGANNWLTDINNTIAGGTNNFTMGAQATIGGGNGNVVNGTSATVAGGYQNSAMATESTVSGGFNNYAGGFRSVIAGGANNNTSADYTVVAGGGSNTAAGAYSFAAGRNATAAHQGAFVWSDSQTSVFSSTTNNEVSLRAQNGVRIQADKGIHLNAGDAPIIVRDWDVFANNAPATKAGIGRWGLFMERTNLTIGIPSNDVPGRFFQVAKYSTNGTATQLMVVDQSGNLTTAGTVNGSSDRNAKEDFAPVDPRTILDRVTAMPISEWSYKADAGTRHIGPMAQDFHAAFNVGADDKHITMVDADGVALAAIKGLNQKLEEQKAELRAKDAELQALKARLEAIEKLLTPATAK